MNANNGLGLPLPPSKSLDLVKAFLAKAQADTEPPACAELPADDDAEDLDNAMSVEQDEEQNDADTDAEARFIEMQLQLYERPDDADTDSDGSSDSYSSASTDSSAEQAEAVDNGHHTFACSCQAVKADGEANSIAPCESAQCPRKLISARKGRRPRFLVVGSSSSVKKPNIEELN